MKNSYPVITLCGSTRFKDEFMRVQKELTLKGCIVITVGLFEHSGDNEAWEDKPEDTYTNTKLLIDDLHLRKIDMSDCIYVINKGGYIGESTRKEIEYAIKHNKKVLYLEPIPHNIDTSCINIPAEAPVPSILLQQPSSEKPDEYMPFVPLLEWAKNNNTKSIGTNHPLTPYISEMITELRKDILSLDLNKDKFVQFEKEITKLVDVSGEGFELIRSTLTDTKEPSNVVLNPSYMMREEYDITNKILMYYIKKWSIYHIIFDDSVIDIIKTEINNINDNEVYVFTADTNRSYKHLIVLPFGINLFKYHITAKQVESVLTRIML